ncbi:hypothetical protein ZORO111903_19105 [Zobellia roscoffensis]
MDGSPAKFSDQNPAPAGLNPPRAKPFDAAVVIRIMTPSP